MLTSSLFTLLLSLLISAHSSSGADGHPSSGAIKFKLPCGRGAYVKDVLYENITAYDVASGIMLAGNGAKCPLNGSTVVSNVTIRNVRAQKIAGPAFAIDGYSVEGRPAGYAPFSVRLENVTMLDYAQLGSCSHATVQSSDVSPAVPTKDASCVVSAFKIKTDDQGRSRSKSPARSISLEDLPASFFDLARSRSNFSLAPVLSKLGAIAWLLAAMALAANSFADLVALQPAAAPQAFNATSGVFCLGVAVLCWRSAQSDSALRAQL